MQQATACGGGDDHHGEGVRSLAALRCAPLLPGDGAPRPSAGPEGEALRHLRQPGEAAGLPQSILSKGAGGLLETPAESATLLHQTRRRHTHAHTRSHAQGM